MRARDVRALSFCVVTTILLLVVSFMYLGDYLKAVMITGAWAAFAFTRPRMIRVFRRMRGEPDWSGYYRD